MKLLSVSTFLPYPPDHGTRIRTWNLLSRLSEKDEITLVTWMRPEDSEESLAVCKERFHEVIALRGESGFVSPMSRVATRIRSLLANRPPYLEQMMRQREAAPVPQGDFDVAIAEDDAGLFLMPEVSCPRAVHRHNVFSDTIEGLKSSGELGMARRIKWSIELPMWRSFDRSLMAASQLSLVTTPEAGRSLARAAGPGWIEVVPNGVERYLEQLEPGPTKRVVFIGTMDYEPNADGAIRFVKRVWPLVREQHPEATFAVIGRRPFPSVQRLARLPGVEVMGEVEDVIEACRGARLGVVALWAGSGIKNKTIELMSMGLPVVSTPAGTEGIEASPNNGIFETTDDQQMADAICRLLKDKALAEEVGEKGRSYVSRMFSWDEAAATYRVALQKLTDGHGRNQE